MLLTVLSEDELRRIEEASFDILEQAGAQFRDCPSAIQVLMKAVAE